MCELNLHSKPRTRIRIRLDKTLNAGMPLGNNYRCNLRCLACHNDYFSYDGQDFKAVNNRSFVEFVQKIIAVGEYTESFVYLAGSGEPTTVGVSELSELISLLKGVTKVSKVIMTTNGILLDEMAQTLRDSGLDGVRVSINSLKKDIYHFYTNSDNLRRAMMGVKRALDAGMEVKINVLYTKLNSTEVDDFMHFSQSYPGIIIKFLDVLPGPNNTLNQRLFLILTDSVVTGDSLP